MKLGDLARQLDCELRGPSEIEIDGLAGIEEATASQLTFVSNPKYYSKIPSTRAGAIVVSRDAPDTGLPTLLSDNPYLAFARAIPLFYRPPSVTGGI
ncbi:MAG: UDP-3-O-(3-hydroxymyristoyl)glucosamine N-acyltransferase, partial [Candidatus Aminicenantes bacterium]|nr:UDP-3-O-(3-hydroxymyristoyl)glucosamine N-acyltransferase [Candidatus Aminicenantes bacterium]